MTMRPGSLSGLGRLIRPTSISTLRPATTLPRCLSTSAPSLAGAPPKSWAPTPFVTETVAGGWQTSDIFSRLLKERIIYLEGEVDGAVSASIVAQLLFLEADNPEKPIHMYINSPGGSVTAGLAIYDTMTYIASPVSTICVGQAASMGSLLLCGGHPGKRYCLPHSTIMVHQPSGGYMGQATDIAIHAKEILRVRKQLNQIYKTHLNGKKELSLDDIEKLMERDYFMGAQEALELGVVDEILDRRANKGEEKGGK
ncbi:hypothetical protein N7474_005785 [Penicillium riverlandense]|uniref:uncharacterized protein n=1 Tax=Penicillium riverlandense TaxID=1903569 RepID=UPI0025496E51|nr:uncharacterized protein N7474_005785 [Penicillium riverlandense]KAJ5820194.1 hypothetical protein N7474_005785 [Penicillium riverlandense]